MRAQKPRSDAALAAVVLVSIALVLGAPVAGRAGFPALADALMALAAGGGLAAFLAAAVHTLRSRPSATPSGVERSER